MASDNKKKVKHKKMLCKNDIKLKTLKNVRRILLETLKKIYKKGRNIYSSVI